MPEWLIPLLSAGIGGAQQLFGGQGRQRYEPSKYEQMVIDKLMEQYRGDLPGWLTAPYYRQARELEKRYARQPGVSGLVSGIKARDIFGPMGEAGEAYKANLMSTIGGLTRGTGEMVTTQPRDFSSPLWDLGYALATRRKKGKTGGGIVPGQQHSVNYPAPYRPGRERSIDYPYLW